MKRMVSNHTIQDFEDRITALEEGGSGTTVSGTNDGTNWTSLTIDEDTYGIPSGGGEGLKTYGLKLEDLHAKYQKGLNIEYYSVKEMIDAGLPILETTVGDASPYTDNIVLRETGEAHQIILNDLFGIVRQENGEYVVRVFRTGSSSKNAPYSIIAYRNGKEEWMLKNARWSAEKPLVPDNPYVEIDFTDVATYFEILNENVGLYYYDSDIQQYVSVGSGTYDPDVDYYTESLGNYYPAPMTPEAYFNYQKNHISLFTYDGYNYIFVTEDDTYDATQTYYISDWSNRPYAELCTITAESDIAISSKVDNNLITSAYPRIQLTNPVMNVRYGNNQLLVPTAEGNYVLGVGVNSSGNPTFSWSAPSIPADIAVSSATIANNIDIYSDNNAYAIYCSNNALPFEMGSVTGAWIRIDATGLVSLTSVDSTTSTAHLYEFKPDGIYLDNVKITS